jgi:hypothetical protein
MRLELTGQPGGFLSCLSCLLPCLVALGLSGSHSLGHPMSLGGSFFALFLGGLFLVSQSGAQLGGLGLGGFIPRFCLRQLCSHLVELAGGFLSRLLLLGQRQACLVGVLVCPVQLGAQLGGPALDLLCASVGGVGLFLGGGQLVAQLFGITPGRALSFLNSHKASFQTFNLISQSVSQLGCLSSIRFQFGTRFFQSLAFSCQPGVRQLQSNRPDFGSYLGQTISNSLRRCLA